jgi:hypothetical protein
LCIRTLEANFLFIGIFFAKKLEMLFVLVASEEDLCNIAIKDVIFFKKNVVACVVTNYNTSS